MNEKDLSSKLELVLNFQFDLNTQIQAVVEVVPVEAFQQLQKIVCDLKEEVGYLRLRYGSLESKGYEFDRSDAADEDGNVRFLCDLRDLSEE